MSFANIYHSVDKVLEFLKKDDFKNNPGIAEEVNIYENMVKDVKYNYKSSGDTKKKQLQPLIVLEGLDGSGKSSTTRKLAEKLSAVLLCTPPKCIYHLRRAYESEKYLRPAYYALGNYIAALEIEKQLETKPVILDRFWHSTAAYEMASSIKDNFAQDLPHKESNLYVWPGDLLKPDLVFYLEVNERERRRRHSLRNTTNTLQEKMLKEDDAFRNNVENAYKNMRDPAVVLIDSNGTVDEVAEDIFERIKHLLPKMCTK